MMIMNTDSNQVCLKGPREAPPIKHLRAANYHFLLMLHSKNLQQMITLMTEGRISWATFDRFYRLWKWGSLRFTGDGMMAQERFCSLHGPVALGARISRVHLFSIRSANLLHSIGA